MKQRRANLRATRAAVADQRPARAARVLEFLERRSLVLAVALILLASVRIIATYNVFSNTCDEGGHIAAGMEWLDKGVYRWEAQHPPLARVAGAVGPYLLGIRSQGTPNENGFSIHMEGLKIVFHDNQFDRNMFAARLGMLPFFWVACLSVYWLGRRIGGPATGVLALLLFSFVPPVLAHAGLTNTDMALTAWLGAAFVCGLFWLERPGIRQALAFGASTALMVLAKFSCLAFFPAIVAIALGWYWIAERPQFSSLLPAARRRLPTFILAVLSACLLIWAGYRFSFGPVSFLPWKMPAPELFEGIMDVKRHNATGHISYFLGQQITTGVWYFFEVALAVKTPLAFLALAGIGAPLAWRKGTRFERGWLALVMAAAVLLVGSLTSINIGVRHVLPVYIGLAVLAAMGTIRLLEWPPAHRSAGIAAAVLAVWLAGSSLASHPDYLAYFNELAGSEPEKILVDSDLDWGQDIKRLSARLRELGARELHFSSIFPSDFRYNGLPPTLDTNPRVPNPGWNAVGLTQWKTMRMGLFDKHPEIPLWPDRYQPTERVGKSILLYYFPYNTPAR